MRTAESILRNELVKKLANNKDSSKDRKDAILLAMKIYTKECIAEDRKNVAQNAKIQKIFTSGYKYETSVVKKSSIINAPQIKLL